VADDQLRVVIGEDDVLLREGIARLLSESGITVAAQAGAKVKIGYHERAHRRRILAAASAVAAPQTG